MDLKKEFTIITKITILAFIFNAILLAVKITLGIIGNSGALINGAFDSGLDLIASSVILFVGRFSRKKADKSHQYGHEKFESVIAIVLGLIMIVTAIQLMVLGGNILSDYFKGNSQIKTPNVWALIGVVFTVIVKACLFLFTYKSSKRAKSPSLRALAVDHISDVFVSLVLIIGILGAIHGLSFFEPIAGIIVAIFIAFHGINIIRLSIGQVVDESASKEMNIALRKKASGVEGVKRIDILKSRKFGMKLYVDIEIAVDGNLTVNESHNIAEKVRHEVENAFEEVKHCMVHVNPFE